MTDLSQAEREALRRCYDCGLPIPDDEKAIQSKTGNAWKHFECWYDGYTFPRDPLTGVRNV